MFNINKLMETEYHPAENVSTNSSYKLKLSKLTCKILVILISDFFMWIIKLFIPTKLENVSGKLALITGGANGLGKALCLRLAEKGCDIAVVDIDYKAACQTAREIVNKFGVTCRPYYCDISEKTAVQKLKIDVENEMRGVDILVNNAGLVYASNYLKSDIDDIERTVKVNFTSQMMITRTFVTGMIERKYGRILTVCSIACVVGGPILTVYTATKKGLDGFMQSFADDLMLSEHDKYIKLTTVYPDFINSRQEITMVLDQIKHFLPRLSPKRVAEDAVRGLLAGKEFVHSSDITLFYYAMKFFSTKRSRKYILSKTVNLKWFYD